MTPMTAAIAAITRPAPSNQGVAMAQAWLAVCQKTRSQMNVATKNAIGNGTSIGWMGWPAIFAVLRGFGMVGMVGMVASKNGRALMGRLGKFRCNNRKR